MRSSILSRGLTLTLLSAAVAAANAGTVTTDGQDIVISTKGGFAAKTADGKHAFKIGGRVQLDYNNFDGVFNADQDGNTGSDLFFRRARLFVSGTIDKDWDYKVQFNVGEDGGDGGSVEDLFIRYTGFGDLANLTFGKQKESFGLEELTSSKHITAIERSAPTSAFAPGRGVGVQLSGFASNWTYGVGVFRNDEGGNDEIDWAMTGRTTFAPIVTDTTVLHLGAAVSQRDGTFGSFNVRPELRAVDGSDRIQSADFDDYGSELRMGLEAAAVFGPFHAQAEYFDSSFEGNGGSDDYDADGYYAQVGFFLTGESRPYDNEGGSFDKVKPNSGIGAWELFARFSQLDLSADLNNQGETGNAADIMTVGVNWYATSSVRAGINYVMADYDNAINGEDDGSAIAARLQIAF